MNRPPELLMTPGEVARALGVNPKTVSRWCREDRIGHMRTPGGHRRIPRSEVERLLRQAESGPST